MAFVLRGPGAAPQTVEPDQLARFAESVGLASAAPGRYSALLTFQLMAYSAAFGLDPFWVVGEIRRLETGEASTLTKPPTPFNPKGSLGGLWHKHFTSSLPSMIAANILAARPEQVLKQLVVESLADDATAEALDRFVHRVVVDGYEKRAGAAELTGEWLVYLPWEGSNLYLCMATHVGGNDEVLGYLRGACVAEFPSLREALPKAFQQTD